jgi:hypothetical protein
MVLPSQAGRLIRMRRQASPRFCSTIPDAACLSGEVFILFFPRSALRALAFQHNFSLS